jgi:hypothetical protein
MRRIQQSKVYAAWENPYKAGLCDIDRPSEPHAF